MPANTVKIDRTTLFGNPFSIEDYGHDRAVALHRAWIRGKLRETGISAARRQMLKERRKRVSRGASHAAGEESGLLVSTAGARPARQLPCGDAARDGERLMGDSRQLPGACRWRLRW